MPPRCLFMCLNPSAAPSLTSLVPSLPWPCPAQSWWTGQCCSTLPLVVPPLSMPLAAPHTSHTSGGAQDPDGALPNAPSPSPPAGKQAGKRQCFVTFLPCWVIPRYTFHAFHSLSPCPVRAAPPATPIRYPRRVLIRYVLVIDRAVTVTPWIVCKWTSALLTI